MWVVLLVGAGGEIRQGDPTPRGLPAAGGSATTGAWPGSPPGTALWAFLSSARRFR
ncbi:MAG: hypothetical protein KJO75_05835 [Dactylosporangium sp.]|nr:hypothetical protein [Dactylosporangium sp.]